MEGSWTELLQKLKDGEIDLLSDVSFMEERTESMLYPSLPMGTEAYYIFVAPDNTDITAEDYTSLNGKRVGVAKNSFQEQVFRQWAQLHGVEVELTETTGPEDESLPLLGTQFDAFVTMDVYGDPETAVPVCKIGSSDFYFAVSKARPDLLIELDAVVHTALTYYSTEDVKTSFSDLIRDNLFIVMSVIASSSPRDSVVRRLGRGVWAASMKKLRIDRSFFIAKQHQIW